MSNAGKILYYWPDSDLNRSLIFSNTSQLENMPYDIAIIGAGVVGTALACKLSQYKLKTVLIDSNFDVGEGTSKGSSAIIHTGFDAPVGTLESELVTKAALEWPKLAEKLKIPLEKCGAMVIAISEEQEAQLGQIYDKGIKNGVQDIERLTAEEVRELEPNVSAHVKGGILVPRESIADPFSTSVAFSELALQNGTDILLGVEVAGFEDPGDAIKTIVTTGNHKLRTKIIVNVAGLGSEKLAKRYGGEAFDTNPRRGQFIVFDKYSRPQINRIFLPIPTAKTKGVLVAPTIFGNLIAGPTAEDFTHDDDSVSETTTEKLEGLLDGASKLYPGLKEQPPIGIYAGVRSNCDQGSYWIRTNDNHPGILTVAGIRSTGFTSSPALADYLTERLQNEMNLSLEPDPEAVDTRDEASWPGWWKRRHDDEKLVKEDPDNAKMVCFCEQITHGDIIRHLDSPLQPRTLDAIKRRTRTQTGRCQGFDCMVNVAGIISKHCEIPLNKITKKGPGSEITSSS
ncbi:MAG: NAD(P)/FAD-dependent oxidoreductase [Bacteroidota bacterium]